MTFTTAGKKTFLKTRFCYGLGTANASTTPATPPFVNPETQAGRPRELDWQENALSGNGRMMMLVEKPT